MGRVQRAVSDELESITDYLSYGLFDWAITDADAVKALEMLKDLPKYQQAVFFSWTKYVNRLRSNLPQNRVAELSALEASVADITPPRSDVADIQSALSYGFFDWVVTDKEAIQSLETLKRLPDAQLAVAIGAINYDRLMDNLPDSRKQELIDLVARASRQTGGQAETGAATEPGPILNAVTFKSDHGLLRDNTVDWSSSGRAFGKPHWFLREGAEVSHPISQTRGTRVEADVNLNVLPATSAPEPVTIDGKSDVGLLDFHYSGTLLGGLNRRVSMTSIHGLPNKVAAFDNERIEWTITWRHAQHKMVPATGTTVFVTLDRPRPPGEATVKRMAAACAIIAQAAEDAGAPGTSNAHDIARGLLMHWNRYDLNVPMRSNIWTFADQITVGGQCIDIVRFILALFGMVGCPGEAEPVVIWANPDSPTNAIEQIYEGPVGLHSVGAHPTHHSLGDDWFIGLLDGQWHSNAYEAAMKLKYGGKTLYYAGGAGIYETKQQVLEIFRCLAWMKRTTGLHCRIMEVPASYHPSEPCSVGAEPECALR
jgi:hypothetical protein